MVTVTADNVEETGFFCRMSAKNEAGYQRKLAWPSVRSR